MMVDFSSSITPTFVTRVGSNTDPSAVTTTSSTDNGGSIPTNFAADGSTNSQGASSTLVNTGGLTSGTTSATIPVGGQYTAQNAASNSTSSGSNSAGSNSVTEDRAIIYDQTGLFATTSSMMTPLADFGGVIFPFTPTISTSHRANYDVEQLIHTNYGTPYYTNSTVDNISVTATFTCQTPDEAAYIDAMKHFFKTATKMFYGQSTTNQGSPPPIFFFDAHGPMAYDHIPVLIKDFDYSYSPDVDYISSEGNQWNIPTTKVPVIMNITLNLLPAYSRNAISNTFGLNQYANGSLLTQGTGSRNGGWI